MKVDLSGDIITQVDGKQVLDPRRLQLAVIRLAPGTEVNVDGTDPLDPSDDGGVKEPATGGKYSGGWAGSCSSGGGPASPWLILLGLAALGRRRTAA